MYFFLGPLAINLLMCRKFWLHKLSNVAYVTKICGWFSIRRSAGVSLHPWRPVNWFKWLWSCRWHI